MSPPHQRNEVAVSVLAMLELVQVTCSQCGCVFGLGRAHSAALRESHEGFYCPNGHPQYYPAKTEAQIQKERADALADKWRKEAEAHEATKREAARLATRAKNGVCPCCNRSFTNVARHMKTKHPGKRLP
jgi:hypothetical protein